MTKTDYAKEKLTVYAKVDFEIPTKYIPEITTNVKREISVH